MTERKNLWIMAALALALVLALAGCPTDGSDGGGGSPAPVAFPFENLYKSAISDSILATVGLSPGALNSITATSNYRGWGYMYDPGEETLILFWTGKNETDFNNMKTAVGTSLGIDLVVSLAHIAPYTSDNSIEAYKKYGGDIYECGLLLVKKDLVDDGVLIPAGAMALAFGRGVL